MKTLFANLALLLLPLMLFGQTTWQQTSASVSFTIKNMGSNVTGTFGAPNTTLVFSPDKLEASSLKGSVSVNTINTGISKRDEDLKSSKYFDAGNHPRIDLASTKLAQNGDKYIGTFNITIKGTSKQIEIPFEFTQSGSNAEFKGDFTINRRDFGVGTKGGLARFLSDDVHVHIAIKAKS